VLLLLYGKKNQYPLEDFTFSQNSQTFGEKERLEE
jgi:hypothetical protein